MSSDSNLNTKFPLWVLRPVEKTLGIYANWAASYDDDLAEAGYETPHRIAAALTKLTTLDARILDFGCGMGLSGQALQMAEFTNLDDSDISATMLNTAQSRNIYSRLWQGQPGEMTDVTAGQYDVIVAAGVVYLGAGSSPDVADHSYTSPAHSTASTKQRTTECSENRRCVT